MRLVAGAVRTVLRILAAGCLLLVGLLWWPSAATADGHAEAGWWYRYNGSDPTSPSSVGSSGSGAPAVVGTKAAPRQVPPTLPPTPIPPPTAPVTIPPVVPAPVPPPVVVPEGGIYVANDSAGPVAVGALRFATGPVGEVTLELAFGTNGLPATGLPIIACPIDEGFQAVANGPWPDRPADDCDRASSTGVVSTDGSLMRWTLPSGFQEPGVETLDVVILPTRNDGSVFSVVFEAPSATALSIIGPPPPRPTVPDPPPFRPDPAAPAAAFNTGTSGGALPPRANVPAPSATPGAAPPGVTDAPTENPVVAPILDAVRDRTWARWLATGILLAIGAGLVLAGSGGRMPAAMSLRGVVVDPTAGGRHRGIGRFTRARTGEPPAVT